MSEIGRTKSITLVDAITFNGHEIREITLRPPKVGERRNAEGHLRTATNPPALTAFAVQLIASCANVKEGVIEQMYDDQFAEAWDYVAGFLGGATRSGIG